MMRVLLTACSEGFNFIDDYLYIYIINFQDLEYYLSKGGHSIKSGLDLGLWALDFGLPIKIKKNI